MTATEPMLEVQSLTVKRGGKTVVRDVSLSVQPGQIVGLIGPNGAGKSTTFHALVGLVPCQARVLSLAGQDLSRLAMFQRARRGLGYLPQGASVFHGLSVQNNLRAVMEIAVPREDRPALLKQLLTKGVNSLFPQVCTFQMSMIQLVNQPELGVPLRVFT